jgi:flavin reductase (DIM6/NTAB) family NADH-FMN oxidoreductase RutF
LSSVRGLLEPGPVALLTTAQRGRANVMTLSWRTTLEFEPPLIAGCYASLSVASSMRGWLRSTTCSCSCWSRRGWRLA